MCEMEITAILDHKYISYIIGSMSTYCTLYFTLDWFGNFDNQFNQLMAQFFLKFWKWGLESNWFTVTTKEDPWRIQFDDVVPTAIFAQHFEYLKSNYKKLCKKNNALVMDQQKNTLSAALLQKSKRHQSFLMDCGVLPCYVDVFDNRHVNSNDEIEEDPYACNIEV
ncbi:hypothetical protein CROQUDRAFT_137231 [Cronartium quercuum f. sp. fusiforme G11]|uniref:Uncharacterized protein n=1 Tax=Cronartium quercuum f. sp. fusiforme G11 TaxID=708437 RepID=A0A9P6N519_9BASI|nr:hypothetical protein CROQUDRAFT_137231 [Cronartium quercuum f. sp. fusiforme G11]